MPHFKDSENKLYWLDEGDDPAVWLPQCTLISEDEADLIRAVEKIAYDNSLTYAQKRALEYPPMVDYIDGMVKGDQAQVQTYIDACLAVKAKYPKP
jgi:hypothetical protein